jgi:hypothetical protein
MHQMLRTHQWERHFRLSLQALQTLLLLQQQVAGPQGAPTDILNFSRYPETALVLLLLWCQVRWAADSAVQSLDWDI